jgi:transglutaminase-like putative cysteine protease
MNMLAATAAAPTRASAPAEMPQAGTASAPVSTGASSPCCPPSLGLEVVHETRYDYGAPVAHAHHAAHLQPLQDAAQTLEAFHLQIEPSPAQCVAEVDAFGNARHRFELTAPHQVLLVRSTSRVTVSARFHALRPEASPAWEQVRERLRYVAHGAFEPAVEFVQPSPYVPWHESALAGLRNWAAESLTPGRPVAQAALELMQRLHTQWAYRPRSTGVDTPLVTAFEQRAGVCQDFAHLLIGAWRLWGLPARYASGYLLTEPAAGEPVLVGADASHAWVQLWCPGTPGVGDDGWLDLDPTNNLVPATGHVRVAMGRDFGDVTPLRGVIRGGGVHTLSVGVTTRRWTPAQ